MGVDYSAKAILGVYLPSPDDLPKAKIMRRKRAFDHDAEDNGEFEFDPKTGKKLWLDGKESIDADYPAFIYASGEFDDEYELLPGQKLVKPPRGLDIVCEMDEIYCLGVVVETGSTNGGECLGFKRLPDVDKIKAKIKDLLEPLGLWKEKDFGLYALLNSDA